MNLIEAIEALKRGEAVEIYHEHGYIEVVLSSSGDFLLFPNEKHVMDYIPITKLCEPNRFRVKPKRVRGWINLYADDAHLRCGACLFETKEQAVRGIGHGEHFGVIYIDQEIEK